MKKTICSIVYYIFLIAVSISISSAGVHPNDVRWWIIIIGMCVARMCGRISECNFYSDL